MSALFAVAPGSADAAPPGLEEDSATSSCCRWRIAALDNLFGLFPTAEGLLAGSPFPPQIDKQGTPYPTLPQPLNTNLPAHRPRWPLPARICPIVHFWLQTYVPIDQMTGDLVHRWYQEQYQINGGKMDKFAAFSDAGGLVMGYYDASKTRAVGLSREIHAGRQFLPRAPSAARS